MNECTSPLAEAAHDYVERGLAIIPLGVGKKEPVTKNGLNDWTDNPGQIDVWWGQGEHAGKRGNPSYNVGMACGQVSGGIIAIDLDCHSADANGADYLHDWEVEHGKLPETWTQITGSGGKQLFYRASQDIRNSANGEIGVDVRGNGGYVVLPPSLHPCGECYEWSISPDDMDVADADDKVYDFIRAVSKTKKREDGWNEETTEIPSEIKSNRNDTLFSIGRSLLSRGFDHATVGTMLRAINSTNCRPPLPDAEVTKLIGSVNSKEPGNAERESAVIIEQDGTEFKKVEKRKDVTTYEISKMLVDDELVSSSVKFNVLENRAWKVGPLPWDNDSKQRGLNDRDMDSLFGLFEYGRGIRSRTQFETAMNQYLNLPDQQMNPIKELFSSLPEVKQLGFGEVDVGGERKVAKAGTLILTYLMAPLNPSSEYDMERIDYVAAAEKLLLREIVARAMIPGCKADIMPVLVGSQGIGKSTFVRALALNEQFYLEGFQRFDDENKRRLIGRLVAEVSELDAFNYTELSSIKSVITTRVDNLRQPYERRPQDYPRTCVFVGTTNEGTFLNDQTGARRFLPIVCTRPKCSAHPGLFDGSVDADARQAIAETYADYVADPEAFMRSLVMPADMARVVAEVQEEHTKEDYVFDTVCDYLDGTTSTLVNVKKVFVEGFDLDKSEFTAAKNKFLIADIRSALDRVEGWERMRSQKIRVTGYGRSCAWTRTGTVSEDGTTNGTTKI